MKRSKRKSPDAEPRSGSHTEIHTDADLFATLKRLTEAHSTSGMDRLKSILASLAREFDPSSVTMTSTNIPDAANKLSRVVDETSEATQRVLDVVERQKKLLKEHDLHAASIARLLKRSPIDPDAVLAELEKTSTTVNGLHSLAHQIVEAQEYQDLCSQKIEKVIRLLSSLDDRLRLLFEHLNYPLTPVSSGEKRPEDADIDQSAADDILKRFGL